MGKMTKMNKTGFIKELLEKRLINETFGDGPDLSQGDI